MPLGFYIWSWHNIDRGVIVVVDAPKNWQELAETRGYYNPSLPLLKTIAAIPGDIICRSGQMVKINDNRQVVAQQYDRESRALPSWDGCQKLLPDQYFLLGVNPSSLDSRYLGPIRIVHIRHAVVPVYTHTD